MLPAVNAVPICANEDAASAEFRTSMDAFKIRFQWCDLAESLHVGSRVTHSYVVLARVYNSASEY